MINTNKKIHIYNRFRYIYHSNNRYYIRYNKRYIDLYSIIKKKFKIFYESIRK